VHHHRNVCRLGSSIHYFGASHSLAPKQSRSNTTHYLPYRASGKRDAGTDIGAPAGKIIGATGIGAIAFLRRGGIYLAKTWRTRCVCCIIPADPNH
jgi:hypothetical protein